MRKEEINIYKFSELSEAAKRKAIEDYFNPRCFHWVDEYFESLRLGLKWFGFDLDNYSIDPIMAESGYYSFSDVFDFDKDEESFGKELLDYLKENYDIEKLLSGECIFTGYCGDEDFIDPIRSFVEKPRNITFIDLMEDCCNSLLSALQKDCEYQLTEEYMEDFFEANNYEFLENGELY